MIDKLKAGDKVVVVKDKPKHWNFIEDMKEFLGKTLTVNYVSAGWEYVKVEENDYAWDECFIDWEATSKLNNLSKLSAKITVVNPLIKIKEIIEGQPFKYEYYSEGSFCISLYESEIPISYYKEQLHLDVEICSVNITSDMMEEILKVMKVIEGNLDFFLMKEE